MVRLGVLNLMLHLRFDVGLVIRLRTLRSGAGTRFPSLCAAFTFAPPEIFLHVHGMCVWAAEQLYRRTRIVTTGVLV